MLYLIDTPSPFASKREWQEFLAEMQKLPPSPARDEAIKEAMEVLATFEKSE